MQHNLLINGVRKYWAESALVLCGVAAMTTLMTSLLHPIQIDEAPLALEDYSFDQELAWKSFGLAKQALNERGADAVPTLLEQAITGDLPPAAAVTAITQFGPLAIPKLLEAFNHPNSTVRITAVRSIACLAPQLGEQEHAVLNRLKPMIEDPKGSVRFAAVLAIGRMGQVRAEAVPELIRALKVNSQELDEDSLFARQDASHILGKIGSDAQAAIPALTQLLDDSDSFTRQQARSAIDRITGAKNPPIGSNCGSKPSLKGESIQPDSKWVCSPGI